MQSDFGTQGSVNDSICEGGNGSIYSRTFVNKLIGNEISEILLLVRSDSVVAQCRRVVDVKLVPLRSCLHGEVLIWLKGPVFLL